MYVYLSLCVFVCRCLLEACGDQLRILGEYLLQVFELLDAPLAFALSAIGQLFERIKQFFSSPFPLWSPWPDMEPDDADPSPMSSSESPAPPTSTTHRQGVYFEDCALDLSLRQRPSMSSPRYHSRNPRTTATLDWNPQNPQVPATLAQSGHKLQAITTPGYTTYNYKPQATATLGASTASVSKATERPVQSGSVSSRFHQYPQHSPLRTSSSRLHQSDSQLEKLWSESLCNEPDPIRRRQLPSTSALQLRHERPSLSHSRLAPVNYERRPPYEGSVASKNHEQPFQHAPVKCEQQDFYEHRVAAGSHEQPSQFAPMNCEQQSPSIAFQSQLAPVKYEQWSPVAPQNRAQRYSAELSVAPVIAESDLPRGLVNDGNLCFVTCILQSLGVMSELVSAVQRQSTDQSAEHRSLVSSLSDVLSALHQPRGQCQSPVNPDSFLAAVGGLIDSRSAMIDRKHQRQQDAAEFISCLLQLLRPRLISAHNGQ